MHPEATDCGPPMALMISGMVMNGPTPIMSIMFSAVALFSESPRTSLGETSAAALGSLFCWFMSGAHQIHIQPHRPGNSRGKLPEECVSSVDVSAFAVA